jgi:hypothetical protein
MSAIQPITTISCNKKDDIDFMFQFEVEFGIIGDIQCWCSLGDPNSKTTSQLKCRVS